MSISNRMVVFITRILLLGGMLFSLGWGAGNQVSPESVPPSQESAANLPIELLFSEPQEFDGTYAGGPDEALASAIDSAQTSVDIASYDFDLLSIARALCRAARRGVRIRDVTDTDNIDNEALDMLRGVGLPVVGDSGSALMHDKFAVLDSREIWVGSMNLTVNDAYRNNNNFMRINSAPLAELFTEEFEEMFSARQFGGGSPASHPARETIVGDSTFQVYFSPEHSPAERILEEIRTARTSIQVLAFSFTSQPIAEALVDRKHGGVDVQIVAERRMATASGKQAMELLQSGGIAFHLDGNPRNLHHKVMIFDRHTVIFGSYNFSENAESRNDEVMVVAQSERIARLFMEEFLEILRISTAAAALAG